MKSSFPAAGSALLLAVTLAACDSDSRYRFSPAPVDPPSDDPPAVDPPPVADPPPNILFVIMDDVGIDQVRSMGYGGHEAPAMPTIDSIAEAGVRFRNTWSMPECSPGRSALMTGRYPLRNDIYQAIGPNDLANSQVSPWEMTVAKVLKGAGYESGMFGKFHLAGPENNEAGNATPAQLGWDYFYGWTGGLPGSIDTTAGGIAPAGTYSCGFVPEESEPNGAYYGACYVPEPGGASCTEITGTDHAGSSAGLQCLTRGGILVPNAACEATPPAGLVFDRENAHYVSPLVVNAGGEVEEATLLDPRARGFRSTIEIDAAIDWINSRSDEQPWMATVSFSSPHTPLHPPPAHLLRSGIGGSLTADCTDPINQRRITDALIEALDTELARLLVETGIATEAPDGNLVYDPAASDAMVIVVGDNGSFGPTVKLPFDATRAKGSAYQTGIWVPLIVSGPLVEQPGRDVEHMVNSVDVFGLFAEIAGVDVDQAVPRGTDAETMMPYLTDPAPAGVREINFAQGGLNIQANGAVNGPCVFNGNSCSHTPVSKTVCEDNGGVWWGKGADHPDVLQGDLDQCWEVNRAIYEADSASYASNRIEMAPTVYQTVRNDRYKLVRNWALDFDPATYSGQGVETEEFYRIDQDVPVPRLDRAGENLLERVHGLDAEEQSNYDDLKYRLDVILASQVACPGDGNDDGVVDQADVDEHARISRDWGLSSSYDFNRDGLTDAQDLEIINDNLGTCPQ